MSEEAYCRGQLGAPLMCCGSAVVPGRLQVGPFGCALSAPGVVVKGISEDNRTVGFAHTQEISSGWTGAARDRPPPESSSVLAPATACPDNQLLAHESRHQ